jgi:hypothetical protein
MSKSKFFILILIYTVITIGVGIALNLLSIFQFFLKVDIENILKVSFFFLLKCVFLYHTIKLFKDQQNKLQLSFLFYYWMTQTFAFGFSNFFYYVFTTGPQLFLYVRSDDSFKIGYFFKYWTQEMSFRFNPIIDINFIGINVFPILLLICLRLITPHKIAFGFFLKE